MVPDVVGNVGHWDRFAVHTQTRPVMRHDRRVGRKRDLSGTEVGDAERQRDQDQTDHQHHKNWAI
jgi:hypothetical protein